MKNLIFMLTGMICLGSGLVKGQNLVMNPSFEEFTQCPHNNLVTGLGTIYLAKFWYPGGETSDYFNACALAGSTYGVPKNFAGFQFPHSGDAYVGVAVLDENKWTVGKEEYREYIQGRLLLPLKKDSVYRVSFFLNRSNTFQAGAIDRFGLHFSKDSLKAIDYAQNANSVLADLEPQVFSRPGQFLIDTMDWIPVCSFYKALGGESFFTMGNFFWLSETNYLQFHVLQNEGKEAYYYIDDVSVEPFPAYLLPTGLFTDHVICRSDSVLNFTLPNQWNQVAWSTGDSTNSISITGPGTFQVMAELDGCLFLDTFQISYRPPLEPVLPGDSLVICDNKLPIELKSINQNQEILWSNGDTTTTTFFLQSGLIWVAEQHECGSLRDSMWLISEKPPLPNLGDNISRCDSLAFQMELSVPESANQFSWSTGQTDSIIHISMPGIYWLMASNSCGIYSDSLKIEDLSQLKLDLGPDISRCFGPPLLLKSTPGFDEYEWNNGFAEPDLTIVGQGIYWITAFNKCGFQTDTIQILEGAKPEIELPALIELPLGDSVLISTSINHDKPLLLNWTGTENCSCFNCENPLVWPVNSTKLILTAIDSLYCQTEKSTFIQVIDQSRLFVPNVFSPNGDGENDWLIIYPGNEFERLIQVSIFDRWGELLFENKKFEQANLFEWDGFFRGKLVKPGVYVIQVLAKKKDGFLFEDRFSITIFR